MRGWTSLFSRLVGRQAEASTSGRCGKGTTAAFTSLSTEGEAPYTRPGPVSEKLPSPLSLPIVETLMCTKPLSYCSSRSPRPGASGRQCLLCVLHHEESPGASIHVQMVVERAVSTGRTPHPHPHLLSCMTKKCIVDKPNLPQGQASSHCWHAGIFAGWGDSKGQAHVLLCLGWGCGSGAWCLGVSASHSDPLATCS